MNCIIVDDDKMGRFALRQAISQVDFLDLKAECATAVEAVDVMNNENIDLVFLDVEMPEMSGLEFLKLATSPLIILITAKRDYAVEAFEHQAVDYIVKPFTKARLDTAISRAKELFDNRHKSLEVGDKDFIFIRDKNQLLKIKTADILYFQALGDYVTIHTSERKYTVRLYLKTVEERLTSLKFIRVHRSYIVALDKVESLEENTISVNNNLIPVSEMYRSQFLTKLNLL